MYFKHNKYWEIRKIHPIIRIQIIHANSVYVSDREEERLCVCLRVATWSVLPMSRNDGAIHGSFPEHKIHKNVN